VGVAKELFSIGNITLAVDFFTALYRPLRIGKKTAVGYDMS
jgi:hypothetical protein